MIKRIAELVSRLGRLGGAELYLILVLLVFGTAATFLLPVSGGYDEEEHLIRVWEMSDYTFLPNQSLGNELPFPRVYWEMSYRRDPLVRSVPPDFWQQFGRLSLDSMDYVYHTDTRSVYSPPLLLPQALVMRFLGRSQQWPALAVYYACRLAGLIAYTLLCLCAVRLIPSGKWTLAVLASSPVAILQSATITPDTISNGIAFLFTAGILAIARKEAIRWREIGACLLLAVILFWGKVNIVPLALLPLLILNRSRFHSRYGYFVLAAGIGILGLLEVGGWNLFAYARYPDALEGADPLGQVRFILADPIHFTGILYENLRTNWVDYLRAWIAIYGLDYWPVPAWTYPLYAAGLIGTLFLHEQSKLPERIFRTGLILTFAATYVWTIVALYLSYTPVGSEVIRGVQGRYFAGVIPLLFTALVQAPFLKRFRLPYWLPALLAVASLSLYTFGMYLSYHVECGSQYYTAGLCYQPNYKNWAPNEQFSEPLSVDLSLRQEAVAECGGMSEFRVWMDATAADPSGLTRISLTDVQGDHALARMTVSNDELPRKNWFVLSFPPEWNSDGRVYVLDLQSYSGKGPRLAYSLRPEYLEGRLYENGEPIGRDLIFQMGCVAGWQARNH